MPAIPANKFKICQIMGVKGVRKPAIPAIPANPPCTAGPRMAQDARAPADRGDLGVAFLRQLRRWFATVAYARDRLCDSSGKRLRQLRRGCDSWAKDWFSDDLPLMS